MGSASASTSSTSVSCEPQAAGPLGVVSVLWETAPAGGGRPAEPPAHFADLRLDQVVDHAVAGRAEYELAPHFYGCGQLKTGAPARGERVAKYNRLVEIAAANPQLPYGLSG